jgi:hypothetical protein
MQQIQFASLKYKLNIRLVFQLCLVLGLMYLSACSKKTHRASSRQSNTSVATSRDPGYSSESGDAYSKGVRAKKSSGTKSLNLPSHEEKVREFEERMEANAKRDAKKAKEMQKPQYSDPSYFGHKKKPKKRPVGKRKFCKECGIVH